MWSIVLFVVFEVVSGLSCFSQTSMNSSVMRTKLSSPDFVLKPKELALVNEAFRIKAMYDSVLWPKWEHHTPLFLYRSNHYEYLFNHPNPPLDFQEYGGQKELYYRPCKDTVNLQSFDIVGGLQTVIMTTLYQNSDIQEEVILAWILQSIHEMFHCFQIDRGNSILNALGCFTEDYLTYNDLSFPYLYEDRTSNALVGLESEIIFTNIGVDSILNSEKSHLSRALMNISILQQSVIKDTFHLCYKRRTEWLEGVARYLERELALHLLEDPEFLFSKSFQDFYPNQNFDKLSKYYLGMTNPIRFVGRGVKCRTMFYYSGMGKAYLLDRLKPNWKADYFSNHLDQILLN